MPGGGRRGNMRVNTKVFGEIDIEEEKIITFEGGIIGFPNLKKFVLLYDAEIGTGAGIRWLQSLDEPGFAMPVMDPLIVTEEYNPDVDDDLLKGIGPITQDNLLVLVTVTVPSDLTKMSVNLQGPLIINVDERKACQVVVDADRYPVKHMIYEILEARKAGE